MKILEKLYERVSTNQLLNKLILTYGKICSDIHIE